VYLGGGFITVGGVSRYCAAAVGTNGTLAAWNPNVNADVRALSVSGSSVSLGGQFTTVGGTPQNYFATVAP
jgi:hypothetical protein